MHLSHSWISSNICVIFISVILIAVKQSARVHVPVVLMCASQCIENLCIWPGTNLVTFSSLCIAWYSTCCQEFVSYLEGCPVHRVSFKRGTTGIALSSCKDEALYKHTIVIYKNVMYFIAFVFMSKLPNILSYTFWKAALRFMSKIRVTDNLWNPVVGHYGLI